MPACFALVCKHHTGPKEVQTDLKYLTFPKDSEKIRIWLGNAGMQEALIEEYIPLILQDKRSDFYRLCSGHFTDESFTGQGKRRKLKTDAVPTIFEETPLTLSDQNKWVKKFNRLKKSTLNKASTSQIFSCM